MRSIGGSASSARPGGTRRRGPANETGETRSAKTGSVSTLRPPIWMKKLECPIQVMRQAAGVAVGIGSGVTAVGGVPRAGKPSLPVRARSNIHLSASPKPCSMEPGHGLKNRPSARRCGGGVVAALILLGRNIPEMTGVSGVLRWLAAARSGNFDRCHTLVVWAGTWWRPVLFAVVAGHVTNVCVTIFLHRAQTHRSVHLHYLAALPMRLWLWLSTSIVTKEWVACHRKHHAFADREGDPHSPLMEGLRNIVLKGAFYYRKAVRQPGVLEKYGKGTPNDWLERHVLAPRNWLGIALDARNRPLAVRLGCRPARVGGADALDSVLGRRNHQWRRARDRLPYARREGREPQYSADRDLARRRRTAQQPSRRSEVGDVQPPLVRVRHRLDVHPAAGARSASRASSTRAKRSAPWRS